MRWFLNVTILSSIGMVTGASLVDNAIATDCPPDPIDSQGRYRYSLERIVIGSNVLFPSAGLVSDVIPLPGGTIPRWIVVDLPPASHAFAPPFTISDASSNVNIMVIE